MSFYFEGNYFQMTMRDGEQFTMKVVEHFDDRFHGTLVDDSRLRVVFKGSLAKMDLLTPDEAKSQNANKGDFSGEGAGAQHKSSATRKRQAAAAPF